MHLDLPQELTNGTRRERKTGGGWRYALTSWKKFMKAARINVLDKVHYSFDENEQVLSVELVEPFGGWRYALTSWKKFMKAARINVLDKVHYSFDENEQVLSVELVEPFVRHSH
ncbi:hypothetical protein HanPSC8_Chr17g0758961 [Helianthus annuus]|nr:hypothetical protein HanPSC8_Chr17g0758961 [Helianthus annuus]